MALTKKMLAFLLMATLVGVSLGAVHKVGDSAGWTTLGNIDYNQWASSKNFHVGDTIVFEYNNQFHNVKQVTFQDFQSCNGASPIATFTSGSDSITLKRPGHYYFLCGVPGHCEAGQTLDIMVTPASLRPSASPLSAPNYSSSPSSSGSASSPAPLPNPYQSNASSLQVLSHLVDLDSGSWAVPKAFLLMATLVGVSLGAVHKVGDSAGWTTLGNIDYNRWASSKNFHVGDTIVFEYNNQFHNVKQVTFQDFQSCNGASPIATFTSGSDSITLKRPGHYYFLCGVPGHCEAGQTLDIMVTPASLRPSASPLSAHNYSSSPSSSGSASSSAPLPNPYQSNAFSLQAISIWPALISLGLFVIGFAF
ncbi:hypothetical protein WN944_011373 [Citrus x changshan-huyou]|uniref:Phytocyanin domain-containing protein n=1 Tax=Citrus x changshan-huyou TaxID=2935761 RepID=A0AAP0MZB2_9ROSI